MSIQPLSHSFFGRIILLLLITSSFSIKCWPAGQRLVSPNRAPRPSTGRGRCGGMCWEPCEGPHGCVLCERMGRQAEGQASGKVPERTAGKSLSSFAFLMPPGNLREEAWIHAGGAEDGHLSPWGHCQPRTVPGGDLDMEGAEQRTGEGAPPSGATDFGLSAPCDCGFSEIQKATGNQVRVHTPALCNPVFDYHRKTIKTLFHFIVSPR